VLHLRDSPWVDGPGRTILETATRIDRSRVDYHVGAFVSNPADQHPLVDALNQRGLPAHPIEDRGGVGSELVRRIVQLLDRLEIDVLHTSEFRSNVLGVLCSRKRPVRLVSTAHGWITNDLRGHAYTLADRMLLRRFDRVILVSHAMRRRLPRWWVPDERVRVVHNALMTDSYGQAVLEAPRRAPDPRGPVRLLNVGRLSPEKGQPLLLEAVAALSKDFPGLHLSFAGTGPLEAPLMRLATELGLANRVDFLGYVADMPALYARTDLVVQSSFTEGLPNVMLEVAYLGVPVVATDVGGTREVIEHGVSGWLVEPRSRESLELGLRRYLESPNSFVEMALTGRPRVTREFSFANRTEKQTQLYEEFG
jgi:glycosyltransferase involved in cell wall biosynthesis